MGFWRGLGNVATFGAIDRQEAQDTKFVAKLLLESAQSELEDARERTQKALSAYGKTKIDTATGVVAQFIALYKRAGDIAHAELREHKQQLSEMPKLETNIQELGRGVVSAEEIASTAGAAAVGGAAAVAGAYGLAGLIGTASTGTAIATLSGAAASNATLAWLGGGALSIGGAGMAGGAVVLGGIALAPFALIAGGLFAAKAHEQLNEAENFYDKVEAETEKMATLRSELTQIRRGAELLQEVSITLANLLGALNTGLNTIIPKRKRNRVKEYSREEWVHITNTCNTARLLFEVLNTPLMSKKGSFLSGPIRQIQGMEGMYERMGEANTQQELSEVISEEKSCREFNDTVNDVVDTVVGIGMAVGAAIEVGGMIKDWLRKK